MSAEDNFPKTMKTLRAFRSDQERELARQKRENQRVSFGRAQKLAGRWTWHCYSCNEFRSGYATPGLAGDALRLHATTWRRTACRS